MGSFLSNAFLTGIAASIVAQLLWVIVTPRLPILAKFIGSIISPGFNLSGFWVASYVSGGIPGRRNIEIYRMRHFGKEQVTFSYDHYSNKLDKPIRGKGFGLFRTSYLSAVYYPVSKIGTVTGALVLKLDQESLKGIYAHFRDRADAPKTGLFTSKNNAFIMQRIQFPTSKILKAFLGKPCFSDYNEANLFIERHLTNGSA